MSGSERKIRVVINSRKIPTGVAFYDIPLAGPFGKMYKATKQMTVYERVLDEDQKSMLEEAREFSCVIGVPLEVVDLGSKNLLSRITWHLTRKLENPPSVIFHGNIPFQPLQSRR
jgi:hypothetical protein